MQSSVSLTSHRQRITDFPIDVVEDADEDRLITIIDSWNGVNGGLSNDSGTTQFHFYCYKPI